MQKSRIEEFNEALLREEIPSFRAGDTVRVHAKVIEGNRSRIQTFQSIMITRRGTGVGETFTVRKLSLGTGVERIFPLHTPTVDRIEVVFRGGVRRVKLYYLRNRHGKAMKVTEKHDNETTA